MQWHFAIFKKSGRVFFSYTLHLQHLLPLSPMVPANQRQLFIFLVQKHFSCIFHKLLTIHAIIAMTSLRTKQLDYYGVNNDRNIKFFTDNYYYSSKKKAQPFQIVFRNLRFLWEFNDYWFFHENTRTHRISNILASGTYSRLAIGVIIFTHVIAYNETGATTVVISAFIATICATFSGKSIFFL